MELKPITRQEKIIAGQDLTPITRMEKFLKQFGGGGGGLPTGGAPYQQLVTDGDGNAKWEDRLAYTSDPVFTTLMDSSGDLLCFKDDTFGGEIVEYTNIPPSMDVVVGATCVLTIDEQSFNTVVKSKGGLKYIGNLKYHDGDDTGEKFLLVFGQDTSLMLFGLATDEDVSAGTKHRYIKLEAYTVTDYQIDPKYLPSASEYSAGAMSYPDVLRAAFRYFRLVEGETTYKEAVELTKLYGGYSLKSFFIPKKGSYVSCYGATSGNKILVYAVNTDLTKRAQITLNFPSSANDALLSSIDVTEQNIALDGNKSIILKSSDSFSTKRFKITVDDSGAIAATEVV